MESWVALGQKGCRVREQGSRKGAPGPLTTGPQGQLGLDFQNHGQRQGGLAGCPKGPGLAIYLGPTLLRSPGSHTRNDPRSCLE